MEFSLIIMKTLEALSNVAVIFASIAAIYGVNSWRLQRTWQRKHDLAIKSLSVFYWIEEELKYIRAIFFEADTSERVKGPNETSAQTGALDQTYGVGKRYNSALGQFRQLKDVKHEFRALFGKEKTQPFEELQALIREIPFALRMYVHSVTEMEYARHQLSDNISDEGNKRWLEHIELFKKDKAEYHSIIFSWGSENDKFDKNVEQIIRNLAKVCEPYLKEF